MVCLPAEADLFNADGAVIRTPVKGRDELIEIHSTLLPGQLAAGGLIRLTPPFTIWWFWRCRNTICRQLTLLGRISHRCADHVDNEYATADIPSARART